MMRPRVLVCGGREYVNQRRVDEVLDALNPRPICIIHGNARGGDWCARSWAIKRGVLHFPFPAHWDEDGRGAGHIRNRKMLYASKPDLVIAFPGGRGTNSMAQLARMALVEVRIVD